MGEEAEPPEDLGKARGILIKKVAEWLKAPAWAAAAVVAVVVSIIAGMVFVVNQKDALEKDIKDQNDVLGGKIESLKSDVAKNKNETDVTLTKMKDAIRVLNANSPNKEAVNQILSARLAPIEKRLGDVQNKVEQQASLIRVSNPNQILAVIRSEIEIARTNKNYNIPDQGLVDLRNAILTVSRDTPGYWHTAQMVVNYTSEALIASGKFPDPSKVAHLCLGLTSQGSFVVQRNSHVGGAYSKCIVDLDTDTFDGTIFKDCVIRSRGGGFILRNVLFVNCKFVLELPEDPQRNNEKKFLDALLAAQTLSNVRASNG